MSAAPAPERRYAGSAFVTAVLQIGGMLIGGLLAVVVSHVFGKGPQTDGLFAAYGVYTLLLALAQTLRTTVVARMAETTSWEPLDRLLGSALLLSAGFAVALVALAGPLSDVLTGDLPESAADAARTAFPLLWAAAVAQFAAALAAAALAVRQEFALPGFAYVGGGVAALVLLVSLQDPLGTDALALGLAVGSAVTAAVLLGRLAMHGWRPRLDRMVPGGATLRGVSTIVLGAVSALGGQLAYLVTVAFAARLEEGAVTVYTYAFFAAGLLMGATSMPVGIVMAAPITQDWDRRPASLRTDLLAVARFGFILMAPVLAAAIAFGEDVVLALLGDAVTRADAVEIVEVFLVLGVPVATALAVAVPLLAAFAVNRYGLVALAAALAGVVHVAATVAADLLTDTIQGLAAASALSSLTWMVVLYALVLRDQAPALLRAVSKEAFAVAGLAALAFAVPLWVATAVDGWLAGLAAWVLGLAMFILLLHRSPRHWELIARVLRPALDRVRGADRRGALTAT